jgi:hypothetical protein
MTIETKYNIGDEVWVYYNMMPEKKIITHINLYCRKRGTLQTEIRYVLNNAISVQERALYLTKEELLKSL